jgi:hypothetical protein
MSRDDTGGRPAFPSAGFATPNGEFIYPEAGVTARDYFALSATVPVEADGCIPEALAIAVMGGEPPDWFRNRAAALSWWFKAEALVRYYKADAMLAVRGSL